MSAYKAPCVQKAERMQYKDGSKISQMRKKNSSKNKKGIARGCGAILENKRKKTKYV